MKRLLSAVCAVLTTFALSAQEPAVAETQKAEWNKGIATTIGFSQLSLMQWAAGGVGQLSLNTFADAYANMAKGKVLWSNELQAGYGFIHSFDKDYLLKSEDRLTFDSKVDYKAADKFYLSAVYNFRTQFAEGWDANHTEVISNFLAPAYMSLGLGIDYKPSPKVSLNFAPMTGKITIVKPEELRVRYGNEIDEMVRFELGAQLRVDAKLEVENFKLGTAVVLFSDYLDKPLNIKVNWDVNTEAKVSKFFSVTLRTNLIYDDNVMVPKYYTRKNVPDGFEVGDIYEGKGVQFKELFSIGFTYTIGQAKKK